MLNLGSLKIFAILFVIPLSVIAQRSLTVIHHCTEESRNGDACPANIDPVCGFKPDIVCVTTPCNYITYGNACEACHDALVVSYTYGECAEVPPVVTKCSEDSRNVEVCTTDYIPVCGYFPGIVCVDVPCNYNTFSSACEACRIPHVESYMQGECSIEQLEYVPFRTEDKSGKKFNLSVLILGLLGLLFTQL